MSGNIHPILAKYPAYEVTIGIEIHTQLKTESKMFCCCPNKFGDPPNTNICPICTGHPGTLPVVNRKAVEYGILAGLATKCKITAVGHFDRKHYFYPDLPKNFQITQDQKPICREGYVTIDLPDGSEKKIRIFRIHMEEDAGKNIHATKDESYVDLNRAGTPLLEMVTYPDLSSAEETRAYLMRMRAIVQYLGISDANMEEGSFRADTNISVKRKDVEQLGTRVELKNINSFKFITQAVNYEIQRQIELIEDGGTVRQETRLWDTKNHKTVAMRSKETAQDYRYFIEPDIPSIIINEAQIEKLKKRIPELPQAKAKRFQEEYELSSYEAGILVSTPELAAFYEATTKLSKKPKQVSNWMLRNLLGYLKEYKISLKDSRVTPDMFAELIMVVDKGIINIKLAQDVFIDMMQTLKYPSIIIHDKDLKQIDSREDLEKVVREVLAQNPKMVEKYKAGKQQFFMFFVGQAMKATKGKGNPTAIQELLKELLK